MPVIIAKNGPNKGKIFHITESIITIGRDDSQTIKVFDQGISRQHSEIFRIGEMCFIRDLNSTNGTYLNGKKVTEEMLRMGDEITVGNTVLAFEDKSSSAILRTMPNVDFDSNERIDTTTIEINVSKKKPTGEKPIIVGNEIASRNIDVLYKISKLITSESDLHTMLHKTVECIIDVFGAANGYIFLVDSEEPRLNSSHGYISYAVFCLKKKKHTPELHSRRQHCRRHVIQTTQDPCVYVDAQLEEVDAIICLARL